MFFEKLWFEDYVKVNLLIIQKKINEKIQWYLFFIYEYLKSFLLK